MKRATEHRENGLSWIKNRKLTDLDFADDIALLGIRQELTGKVENEAKSAALRMNAKKTKVMAIGRNRLRTNDNKSHRIVL